MLKANTFLEEWTIKTAEKSKNSSILIKLGRPVLHEEKKKENKILKTRVKPKGSKVITEIQLEKALFNDESIIETPESTPRIENSEAKLITKDSYPLNFLIPVMLQVAANRKYPVKRADFFERFMLCILELISLFDFVGDMIVLIGLAQTNNIGWTTLTIMSMLCPYLVSYAPLVTFFVERKRFKTSKSCWASTTKALMMTPVCIIYLIILDLLFIVFTVTLEPIELIFSIITCQRYESLIDVDHILDKILSKSFGLKIMDGKGFKRLRSISQLIFESIPQIFLQIRILTYGANHFGISENGLIFSLGFACLHTLIEFSLLTLESKATKSSLLYYSVVALNGRFNWVPFTEKFSSKGLNLDIELNYGKLRSRVCFSEFEITYTFSNESLIIFSNALRYLPDVEREEDRVIVRLGNTCDDDVSLNSINNAILAAENKVNLDVEEIDFEYFFNKEIKDEIYPLAPNGEFLIIFYAEHGCGRAFLSLLKRGCKIDIKSKKNNLPLPSIKLPESIKKLVFEELIKANDVNLIIQFYNAEPSRVDEYFRKKTLSVADDYLVKSKKDEALKLLGLVGGFHNTDYDILPLIQDHKERLHPLYLEIKNSLKTEIWFSYRGGTFKLPCEDAEVLKAFRLAGNGYPIGYSLSGSNFVGSNEKPYDLNAIQLSEEARNEMEKYMKDHKMKKLTAGCGKCGKEIKWNDHRKYFRCNRCYEYHGYPGAFVCFPCDYDFCKKCYELVSAQSKPSCSVCTKELKRMELGQETDISCNSCRRTLTVKSCFGCSDHAGEQICPKCLVNIYDVI